MECGGLAVGAATLAAGDNVYEDEREAAGDRDPAGGGETDPGLAELRDVHSSAGRAELFGSVTGEEDRARDQARCAQAR